MIEVKKSIETGQPRGLFDILQQLQNGSYGATQYHNVYHVNANSGKDSYNKGAGKSWDRAYKTMVFALARSGENISTSDLGYGRGWSARNAVFAQGTFSEPLVALADKTDIIGCGEGITMTRLVGTHVPVSDAYATRLINLEFRDDGNAGTCFTHASGTIEFHNCIWRPVISYAPAVALALTNPTGITISNCQFLPLLTTPNSTAAITIHLTDAVQSCRIENSIIHGATGIDITVDGTHTYCDCMIINNIIHATTEVIDDASDDWYVINNRMISDGVVASMIDANAARAAGNIMAGSDSARTYPFAVTS